MTEDHRPEEQQNPESPTTQPDQSADPSRRRFAKGSIAVGSAVLFTLANRSALANQCSVSGMMSGNLSNPQTQVVCEGCTPGYWQTHPERWPAPYEPGTCANSQSDGPNGTGRAVCRSWNNDGTRFHSVFSGMMYGDATMMQILQMNGNQDPYQLGAHAVAALLNSAILANFGHTPDDIISMYNMNAASDPEQLKNTFQLLNERFCPL